MNDLSSDVQSIPFPFLKQSDPTKSYYIYILTLLSAIGGFLFGYDTGIISAALLLLTEEYSLSLTQQELVVSIAVAGALFASLITGFLSDTYGRKPVILGSSVLFLLGSLLMSCDGLTFSSSSSLSSNTSNTLIVLYLGRFVVGMGVGSASLSMPVYVSEVAPTENRGSLVTCINVAITFGQFLAACIGYGFSTVHQGWREMLGFAAIPAIIQIIGFLYLPESPRWLLENNKIDFATTALRKLRSRMDVRDEIQEMIEAIRLQREIENGMIYGNHLHHPSLVGLIGEQSDSESSTNNSRQDSGNDNDNDNDNVESSNYCCNCCSGNKNKNRTGSYNYLNNNDNSNSSRKRFGSGYSDVRDSTSFDSAVYNRSHSNSNSNSIVNGDYPRVAQPPSRSHSYSQQNYRHSSINSHDALLDIDKANPDDDVRNQNEINRNSNISIASMILNIKITCSRLSQRTTLRALLLGCALQALQQLGGINTVMYYTATILSYTFSSSQAILLSIFVALCNWIGSMIGLYLVDRVGRRTLTLGSTSAVVISLLSLSACFYYAEISSPKATSNFNTYSNDDDSSCSQYKYCFDCVQIDNCGFCSDVSSSNSGLSGCISGNADGPFKSDACSKGSFYTDQCANQASIGWLLLTCLCVYLLSFAPGLGTMPWTINSEIYPTSVRGAANSIATTVNWSTNLIMSASFLSVVKALSRQGAFLLYAIVAFCFLLWLYIYLPETRGVALEDMPVMFSNRQWGRAAESSSCLYQTLCNVCVCRRYKGNNDMNGYGNNYSDGNGNGNGNGNSVDIHRDGDLYGKLNNIPYHSVLEKEEGGLCPPVNSTNINESNPVSSPMISPSFNILHPPQILQSFNAASNTATNNANTTNDFNSNTIDSIYFNKESGDESLVTSSSKDNEEDISRESDGSSGNNNHNNNNYNSNNNNHNGGGKSTRRGSKKSNSPIKPVASYKERNSLVNL